MIRPAKSHQALAVAGFLVMLVLGFAGQAVADTNPKFVYVANDNLTANNLPGTVAGYSVDGTTGALTPVPGSPFVAGSLPFAVAVAPSNKFVYVTNYFSNNISAYTVDGTTGALTAVSGSPFAAGTAPRSIAIDPSGKFAYVADDAPHNNVWAFTIDATTGALNPVPGSPYEHVAVHENASAVAVDPSGKFLFVANDGSSVLTYAIDSTTGALTAVSSSFYPPGPDPATIAVDPSGKFLYVTIKDGFWAFTVDGTTGELSKLTGSPFLTGGSTDLSVAIDPLGRFAYVTNFQDGTISAYTINSVSGVLTPVTGSPFASTGPFSIAVDPSGKFAYVASPIRNAGIAAYTIDGASGALTPISGSPFAPGTLPAGLAVTHASPTVPFEIFKAKADIDEDRRTSFRVEGFFTLGADSDGINPVSETVNLQVGNFSVTIPAGSFEEKGKHAFKYDGQINDVDLRITIQQADRDDHDRKDRKDRDKQNDPDQGKDYLFTAEGRGHILAGVVNPVTVGLTIGDDEGSTTVKADIDK